VLGTALLAIADSSGRVYGTITTVDGDTYTGLIRWDRNEASWVDILDGTKERTRSHAERSRKKYRDRERSIEIFGVKIGSSNVSWGDSYASQSGIRMGHLKTLEAIDDDKAMLTLKSGEQIEFTGGSTDIGNDVREIIMEDNHEGEIEFVWSDIDRIDFAEAPSDVSSNFGQRLYGTVTSRRGDTYTGFVAWDVDEALGNDILDGEEKDRGRKIKFDKIASIERYSSNGATVTLKTGESMLLRGTNDVNDENRGIIVGDPGFGQVVIPWDEFDKVEFTSSYKPVTYNDFKPSTPLYGTVTTEDGTKYTGQIRWDDDEEYTWELLNGEYHDIQFEMELGLVKLIEKRSYRSSDVTTLDGRTFRLRGSNDVDEDNKGIFIQTGSGDEVEVDWEDFAKVEFAKK
ncbi:MAG TPA: hypothetical protein VJ983_02705, partial [candidate division Zixibacteria bacterium]|nr:hypothetical protein [candidate division Zixibacteria bacterium]